MPQTATTRSTLLLATERMRCLEMCAKAALPITQYGAAIAETERMAGIIHVCHLTICPVPNVHPDIFQDRHHPPYA